MRHRPVGVLLVGLPVGGHVHHPEPDARAALLAGAHDQVQGRAVHAEGQLFSRLGVHDVTGALLLFFCRVVGERRGEERSTAKGKV